MYAFVYLIVSARMFNLTDISAFIRYKLNIC